ncbi:uncharacterized protein METZ01_LOCUS93789, partial [marine metagenome]
MGKSIVASLESLLPPNPKPRPPR